MSEERVGRQGSLLIFLVVSKWEGPSHEIALGDCRNPSGAEVTPITTPSRLPLPTFVVDL